VCESLEDGVWCKNKVSREEEEDEKVVKRGVTDGRTDLFIGSLFFFGSMWMKMRSMVVAHQASKGCKQARVASCKLQVAS